MKNIIAVSAIALGLVAAGTGLAAAESVVVQGLYNTLDECASAGDFGEIIVDGQWINLNDGWSYRCDAYGNAWQMTLVR